MRGHAFSCLVALFLLLVGAGSCADTEGDQPTIPARPGAYQPPGGGEPISEADACERVIDAEQAARRRLVCAELEHAECPFYIRPAGGGCWRYDERTVEGCEDFIGEYSTCSDFSERPCLLTALPAPDLMCPGFGTGAGGEGSGGSATGGNSAGGKGGTDVAHAGDGGTSAGQAGAGGEGGGGTGVGGTAGEPGSGGVPSASGSGSGGEGG